MASGLRWDEHGNLDSPSTSQLSPFPSVNSPSALENPGMKQGKHESALVGKEMEQ